MIKIEMTKILETIGKAVRKIAVSVTEVKIVSGVSQENDAEAKIARVAILIILTTNMRDLSVDAVNGEINRRKDRREMADAVQTELHVFVAELIDQHCHGVERRVHRAGDRYVLHHYRLPLVVLGVLFGRAFA